MKLSDYLSTTGFTKASLARALDVSKVLVGKWDEIPEKYIPMLDGLSPDETKVAAKAKNWDKYSVEEMKEIFLRRGGLEGDSLRDLETDKEIASSLGFSVWEFNMMVDRYCILKRREKYKANGWKCLQDEIDSDGIPRDYSDLLGERSNEAWKS